MKCHIILANVMDSELGVVSSWFQKSFRRAVAALEEGFLRV